MAVRENYSGINIRNVLYNDALNTFYLRLYGVRHMVKDHSDSEKGNQQGFFYMHHPTDRITHTTAFVTQVVEHWLEREIAQWGHKYTHPPDLKSVNVGGGGRGYIPT